MSSKPAAGDTADIISFLAAYEQRQASTVSIPRNLGLYATQLHVSESLPNPSRPAHSRTPRNPSSYDSASQPSTLFDHDSDSLYSLCTGSTAPSRDGPELPGRRPMPPIPEPFSPSRTPSPSASSSASSSSSSPHLPCEFNWYNDCPSRFPLDDTDAWLHHVLSTHLTTLPRHLLCWFCDDIFFHAPLDEHAAKRANYRQRIRHIAEHLRDGTTLAQIRPDFYFLDHLHRHRLISEERFAIVKRFHEAPQPRQGIAVDALRRAHVSVEVETHRAHRRAYPLGHD